MPFQPNAGDALTIEHFTYRVAAHPAAPGLAYGQEGRAAVVYQLLAADDPAMALKVFKPRHRVPSLVRLADQLAPFATLPGLQVCSRTVLRPQQHGELLRQYPDLTYAVLMPWIQGPTWMQVLMDKQPITPEQSLAVAVSLATVLAGMEQHELAHCDLSGPNLLLPQLADGEGVVLVDVEGMYGPGLQQPRDFLSASPGYGHRSASKSLWGPESDRFAGALLLAETLGWCDAQVRAAALGDPGYFAPEEMQQTSERYEVLARALEQHWGREVSQLFERAWHSETLLDCPTFGEWLVALPESTHSSTESDSDESEKVREWKTLLAEAQALEHQGRAAEALARYRQASTLLEASEALVDELALVMEDPYSPLATESTAEAPPSELELLFAEGVAAFDRSDWRKARELLREVVRQSPEFAHAGRHAAVLLAEAERRLVRHRPRLPTWVWGIVALVAMVSGVVWGPGLVVAPPPPTLLAQEPPATPVITTHPVGPTVPPETFTMTPTLKPVPSAVPILMPDPTVAPTPTPEPTATAQLILVNQTVTLQPIANAPWNEFADPPQGKVTFEGVPFTLEAHIFKSQAEPSPHDRYPTTAALSLQVPHPQRVHLLLTAGNAYTRFNGLIVGRVEANCNGSVYTLTQLRVGRNLREWHTEGDVVTAASEVHRVWSGPIAGHPQLDGHIDILTLTLPEPCRTGTLTGLTLVDSSVEGADSRDPAFNFIALTVAHLQ